MNDYNLKTCPFCGGTVKWVHDLDGAASGLRCPECKGFFRWPRIKTNGNHEPLASQWVRSLRSGTGGREDEAPIGKQPEM